MKGLGEVKRNDCVVFNWPADTVRRFFVREKGVIKPMDKKSNYVKRAVGIAGDTLEVINGYVYINGMKNQLPERAKLQFSYLVQPKKNKFNKRNLNFLIQIFLIINRFFYTLESHQIIIKML